MKKNKQSIIIALCIFLSSVAFSFENNQSLNKGTLQTNKILQEVGKALTTYKIDCGSFPKSLNQLSLQDKSCENWGPTAYTKKLKDYWNNDLVYKQLKEGKTFSLKSFGADNKINGLRDNQDIFYKLEGYQK